MATMQKMSFVLASKRLPIISPGILKQLHILSRQSLPFFACTLPGLPKFFILEPI